MKMGTQQIYDTMRRAGFPPLIAETMTAIALRESGGDPAAFNGNTQTGDRSFGLLQINMLDKDVAAAMHKAGIVTVDDKVLLDPATNARAGFLLWGGYNRNLNLAWYINRDGPYKARYEAHLAEAHAAALASEV